MKPKLAWKEAREILINGDITALRDAGLVIIKREDWEALQERVGELQQKTHALEERLAPTEIAFVRGQFNEDNFRLLACIDRVVSHSMSVPVTEIHSSSRSTAAVDARAICCLVARQLSLLSWPLLGKYYNRHHATLLYAAGLCSSVLSKKKRDLIPAFVSQVKEEMEASKKVISQKTGR